MFELEEIISDLKSSNTKIKIEKEKLIKERQRDKAAIIRLADKLEDAEKGKDELLKSHTKLRGILIKIMIYIKGFEGDL